MLKLREIIVVLGRKFFTLAFSQLLVVFLMSLIFCDSSYGIAKQSTLSLSVSYDTLLIELTPSAEGQFGKSSNNTITASTDNFTGYNLSIATSGSTSMLNSNDDAIESINSSIDETTFSTGSSYTNKWGYKPSQYIVDNGGTQSVVSNTNYLPAPSSEGVLLAKTSAANVTSDSYTLSAAAKVNMDLPYGTYVYTYVLRMVGNAITYNITYDENTNDAVNSMPSPNPQAISIDGGTPAAESYARLSNAIPVLSGKGFGGWCDVATTVDQTTGDYLCSGNTYNAGDNYPIDQTSSATNITLYAIWLNDPFPVVWSQMGACEFHGATNGNITGSQCQQYSNNKFIDTGIALYNNTNYTQDYEIHFTIDHYDPSENNGMADQQQTFVSDKLSESVTSSPYDGKAPGVIVRRSGNDIQVRSTAGHTSSSSSEIFVPSSTTTDISVYRINGVIYASINHGSLQQIQTLSNFDQQFGLNTWFGAYPGDDCTGNTTNGVCTNAIRYIEATLSNMYIKLGDFNKTMHTVTFNANSGTPTNTIYKVIDGDTLGPLPTGVTRPNHVLMYWYSTTGGNNIASPDTQPHGDITYYASWLKEAAQATISNSSITIPVSGTATINVTNSAELEPYTFSSSDDTVATVDSTTGLVTGVSEGTATITMTGTKSGTTKTITVNVSDSMVRVSFTTGQGSSVDPIDVEIGGTISELPISIRSGYTLEGWYTGADGTGTKLTTSTQINSNTTFIANWIVTTNVCRLADPLALHKETCSRSTSGCRTTPNPGYSNGAEITYGKIPTDLADPTELKPGLAYTCDINADNEYDEETERFYLLSTTSNTAALVWYKNIVDLSTNYPAAYTQLPDSNTWRNTNLIAQAENKVTRYMKAAEVTAACGGNTNGLKTKVCEYLLEKSNYANTNIADGIWLEKVSDASNGGRRIHSASLGLGNVNPSASGSNNAPRPVIEISLNMLERYSPTPTDYTITFDPQNETSTWDETITPGDDLSSVYPSSNPTYANHIFQGWYTAASGGTQISSSTEPSGDTTYYAQWKGTVALATVANNSISVAANGTATVTVVNAANLEGFSFSSSNTSVATIDPTTGVITPVAEGTTYISITGASSNTTNQIVTVTVTQPTVQYTITFNPQNNNEASPWDETINAGDDLSNVYPTANPTYTDHVFQGWYTAQTNGTLISSSTVPDGSTTYHAQWKGTVALAVLSSNSITVQEGNTATITVTNTSDIEGFTFSSLDSTVATVDSSTGVVTGVAPGSTSIRMTGTTSQTYVDIPVTVTAQPTYTIYFNPHNGQSNYSATIVAGNTIGNNNIPADPTNSDPEMIFMGWYTAASGGVLVDGSTTPSADGETYHAQYKKIVCKLETLDANLHTISNHTYGIIANANNTTQGAPGSGTAYNCDVDYDDTYSPVNERFYYLGTDNSGNSALVAWNSYYNSTWAAGTSSDTIFSYTNALTELPSNASGAWDNPGLIEQETGKAARFSTRNEVATACGKTLSQMSATDALLGCDYFMEHTAYDGGGRSALWLMKEDTTQYRIHSGSTNRHISTSASGSSMVRPTIVVPYKLIEKYTAPTPLDVTNAVIGNSDLTVMAGQTLTIQVTNSASLEAYTFSSDDSSIATVNSSTGVVTGVSAGTVDIIMTGTTSGLTKTIEVEVVADPDTPVVFDVSNDATRGFQALSAQWAQSPVNISTFNKDTTTINNSTWGDTSELSELQYWTAVRNNFVNNQCFIQTSTANSTNSDAVKPLSALSAWTSGNVDCSKPDAYDTGVGAALTVRLNNDQGAVVAYAKADSGVIHNMIPGQTYYWEKTSDSSVYGYVTAVSNGSSTGTRWVDMGVVRNARDLGGLPVSYTSGNQTVTGTLAYGRIFRGEKMQNVDASELTNLGITTEYNVGDEYSSDTHLSDYQPFGVVHYDFDYVSGDEERPNSNYMKAWDAVTSIMTDITNTNTTKNVYIHCRVGADRTGTVAYLLEGLLGVPDEQRYEEYGLTNVSGLYDRTRYYKQKSSTNNLKFVYMMDYVRTNQEIYSWYMHHPNADSGLIDDFRAAMTVPTASQSPAQQSNNAESEQVNNVSPLSLNSVMPSNEINNTGNSSDTSSNDSSAGYSNPLGVSEASESNVILETASAAEMALATVAVAGVSGAAAAFAMAKFRDDDE
ncbi:InlB B-repeat-containing protein [Candidatus Saccharibacteria bacterium]|nr:InlB B-repeat-containing protein [Candidatus Saccharibacteria bacterium]